jgi:3-oxoacyl-[acyl-carrier protein] reductase
MIRHDFSGRVAVVTGGTRGIGAAISTAFLDAGARVVALYGRNRDAAEAFRAGLEPERAERLETASLDVSDSAAVEAYFEAWDGPLDVLVNNAGVRDDAIVGMMTVDQWRRVLGTNLDGSFHMARGAVRLMSRARRGRIINIISPSARLGMPGQANYAASKAGQEAMTRSLAREVAKRKITVNCVSPGFVATDLIADLSDEQKAEYEKMVPLRRFGLPVEIANAVLFLASDEAGYITGTTLDVAGGL